MGVPGPTELIIILVIILLLFGAKRIPDLAKGLGTGMREFRRGASGEIEEDKDSEDKSEKEDSDGKESKSEDGSRSEEDSADEKADKTQQRS